MRNFGLRDGVQAPEYNGGAGAAGRNGELFFGGINGLSVVRPSRLAAPGRATGGHPAVTAGSERRELGRGDALRCDGAGGAPAALRIRCAGLQRPERNRFSYRPEGFDEARIDAGPRHEATYTNLGPARMHCMCARPAPTACGTRTARSCALEITPPWWASGWMKALTPCAASLLALWWRGRARKRAEAARHRRELREREDRLRMALWGSGDEFWDYDMRAGRLYRIGADRLFGGPVEQSLTTDEWLHGALHPDDLPRVQERLRATSKARSITSSPSTASATPMVTGCGCARAARWWNAMPRASRCACAASPTMSPPRGRLNASGASPQR